MLDRIHKFSRFRVYTGHVFLLVIILMAKPAQPALPYLVVGSIFFLFGMMIRILAAGTLVKAEELIRGGIYQMTRNPLYLGSLFLGLGLTIMSYRPLMILLYFVIFIPIYYYMIYLEETFLRSAFGKDFEDYAAKVPRLFPAPGAPPGLLVNFSIQRYKANRELGGNISSLAIALIIWLKFFYQIRALF